MILSNFFRYALAGACALGSCAGPAQAATGTQGKYPVFIGQHILYSQTFNGLQDNLFDGLRIWGAEGTTWAEIEPQKDHFDFKKFDDHVNSALSHHLTLMYTLGQTPRWASARPDEKGSRGLGAAAEPADMANWAHYVRTVATRYKGKITAYEIINEPRIPEAIKPWSPGFFSGSSAALAEMTRITAQEVKKIDPSAKIVCPPMETAFDGLKRLDAFLNTGAGKYCDVISFHYYLPHHSVDELRSLVQETRRITVKHGLGNVPIWNTETGVLIAEAGFNLKPQFKTGPLNRMYRADDAARLAAKLMVVSNMLGVERTYWFAHDTSWMGSTVAEKRLNKLNPFGQSLALLHTWLSGRYLRNCSDSHDSTLCEVHDQGGKVGAIYWGDGKSAAEWADKGYARVNFLNGKSVQLDDGDSHRAFPQAADDVIFLDNGKADAGDKH